MSDDMTDAETVAYIRAHIDEPRSVFDWITYNCGCVQHARFAQYRNDHWRGGSNAEWRAFVLAYADELERRKNEAPRSADGGSR